MAANTKAHIICDSDISEYLQSMASRTGQSVTYCANNLLRMIKSAEQTNKLELKDGVLKGREGKETIKFRKITSIRIDL